jgi:PAS domain-containing protein
MSEDQCTSGHLAFLSGQLADKNSIINAISDALMVLDPKTYQILDVNQSFLKTYGLSGEEVLAPLPGVLVTVL